jgi:hypothetical protein
MHHVGVWFVCAFNKNNNNMDENIIMSWELGFNPKVQFSKFEII